MPAPTDLTAPDLAALDSPQGRAWMAAVSSLVHDLARQWNLITAGDLFWAGDPGRCQRIASALAPLTGPGPFRWSRPRSG